MKIRNLQSLLVCPIILWRVSSTEEDWILGWRSGLASQIWVSLWSSTFFCNRHVDWFLGSFLPRIPFGRIQFLRIRSWRRSLWMCKNVPEIPDVSQIFGGSSFCRCEENKGLNIPSNGGCLGNNPGGLVTCGFPLQVDSASIKSLESFMKFTSFCSSWSLPDNSITVFWSSMNFFWVNSSKAHNSGIFAILDVS